MRYLEQDLKALFKLSGVLYLLVFSTSGQSATSFGLKDLQGQPSLKVQNLIEKYQVAKIDSIKTPSPKARAASKNAMPIGQLLQSEGLKVVHFLQNNLPNQEVNRNLFSRNKNLKDQFQVTSLEDSFFLQPGISNLRIIKQEKQPEVELASESTVIDTPSSNIPVPQFEAKNQLTLEISLIEDDIKIVPESLVFNSLGTSASISINGLPNQEKFNFYVRDPNVISFSQDEGKITPLNVGDTELFFTYNNDIHIISVQVATQNSNDLLLAEQTTELPDIDDPSFQIKASVGNHTTQLKLAESRRKTKEAIENQEDQTRLSLESKALGYNDKIIQIMDERSVPTLDEVYPAGDLTVTLMGTEFISKTDSTGHLVVKDLPQDSRFLMAVIDPRDNYVPTITEIDTFNGNQEVNRINVMRRITFESYTSVAGVVQKESEGSLCATVYDEEGYVIKNTQVGLDIDADGPYYFNRFGFLDLAKDTTGDNGRFCYFNIPTGPIALTFTYGNFQKVVALSSVASFHMEEDFILNNNGIVSTNLGAMATVYTQLAHDSEKANEWTLVDYVDLVPFGEDDSLQSLEFGLVSTDEPLMMHNNRVFAYSDAPEFEPTVYSFNNTGTNQYFVTPMIPNGFIEDMALFANTVQDKDLGTVVFEYGSLEKQTGTVSLKLTDNRGNPISEGWYYGDNPQTKAIFFNLQPGIYLAQALDQDGYWLGSDTVLVYNSTVSYIRLGAKVVTD